MQIWNHQKNKVVPPPPPPRPDVWHNFYEKVRETHEFAERYGSASLVDMEEGKDADVIFEKTLEEVYSECE